MLKVVNFLVKIAKASEYTNADVPVSLSGMKTKYSWGIPGCGKRIGQIVGILAVLALAPAVQAQVLMFDFGPTTPTGANLTNSPGHSAGAISNALTTWNVMGTLDVSSGLLYGDNTAATGISLSTGYETTNTSNIINFALNPGFSVALGGAVNTGVYAGDSVGTDAIFQSSVAPIAVGVQIGGLAAGSYQVYISGRNTNVATYLQNFYATSSSAGTTFDFNSLTSVPVANTGVAWSQGTTYALFTITLGAGEVLNIATEGTGTAGAGRGFLNSLEIVAVPEPSTTVLMVGGALVLLVMIRRKSGKSALPKPAASA